MFYLIFFFKQKTAYYVRISDWSSDVCSSDLARRWTCNINRANFSSGYIREDKRMKLNVGVPNSMHVAAMVQPWEYKLTGADIGEAMKVADELGYNKCMLGEHFIVPQSHIELSGDHYFHTTVRSEEHTSAL